MSFCAITCLNKTWNTCYRRIFQAELEQHVYFHCSMLLGHRGPMAYCSSWVYKSPEMKKHCWCFKEIFRFMQNQACIRSIRWSERDVKKTFEFKCTDEMHLFVTKSVQVVQTVLNTLLSCFSSSVSVFANIILLLVTATKRSKLCQVKKSSLFS